MKTLIILIFTITSLFFFSCQNDGEITIKASLPVRTANSNLNNNENLNNIDTESTNFYIPKDLLEQFNKNNVSVKLHVITPTKQHKEFNIIEAKSGVDTDKSSQKELLEISFDAQLEEGKKRALIVQIGKPGGTTNDDVNTNLMFSGGKIIDIKKGKDYDPIELNPIVNIKGKVFSGSDNKGLTATVTAYPAFTNIKNQYPLKLTRNTSSDGLFNLSSIYGIFQLKYRDTHKKEYFNILLTASQGDKMGFSVVEKEYKDFDIDNLEDNLNKEYNCYKYYEEQGSNEMCSGVTLNCNRTDTSCFNTQSGNLLPGVNIVNDIKIYSKSDIEDMPAITSVSSPKFAKESSLDGDTYNKAYYGNFFISGFNLNGLNKDNEKANILEGTIKIYYQIDKTDKIDNEPNNEFYLEYTGPFTIYDVSTIFPSSKVENAQVIQNRLPFFKLFKQNSEGKIDSYIPPKDLKLDDGLNSDDGSFLGVNGLQKLTKYYKITRVEFNSEEIYPTPKVNK